MVFLIQNTQNREGAALQGKLDEIIRALEAAEDRFIGLERREEEEIVELRAEHDTASGEAMGLLPTGTGGTSRSAVG